MKRVRLPDDLVPGWFAVQVLGTVFIGGTLLTAREASPWLWGCYGLSAACWLLFLCTGRSETVAVASMLTAAVTGFAQDSSAFVLSLITLGRFSSLLGPSVTRISAVGLADVVLSLAGGLAAGRVLSDVLSQAAVLLIPLLLGLNTRQYELRAKQAEQLVEQTRRAAALDERTRIAREIHDVLAHSLGGLGVQLELAEALLVERSDMDGSVAAVRRSRRLAADGLTEARNAVAALRQDVPALPEALRALAESYRRDHRLEVAFQATGTTRSLPSAATVALLDTAREALTNATKHAPGLPVEIVLDFAPEKVSLSVRNPLPPGHQQSAGYGLTGMRERLALAGGTLVSGLQGAKWQVIAEVRT
jgi:signal transduction histidine kinase